MLLLRAFMSKAAISICNRKTERCHYPVNSCTMCACLQLVFFLIKTRKFTRLVARNIIIYIKIILVNKYDSYITRLGYTTL